MKVEKSSLNLANIIEYKNQMNKQDWEIGFLMLDQIKLSEELYTIGPYVFSFDMNEFLNQDTLLMNYYLSVNDEIELNDASENYEFKKSISFEQTLCIKNAMDLSSLEEAVQYVQKAVQENGIPISSTTYVVVTNVYQDQLIDIHFEILEKGESHE